MFSKFFLPLPMKTTFSIPGMHCASCSALIKDVSGEFPEIRSVEVDLEQNTVTVTHDDGFDLMKWQSAINELGQEYSVHSPRTP